MTSSATRRDRQPGTFFFAAEMIRRSVFLMRLERAQRVKCVRIELKALQFALELQLCCKLIASKKHPRICECFSTAINAVLSIKMISRRYLLALLAMSSRIICFIYPCILGCFSRWAIISASVLTFNFNPYLRI